MKRLAELVKKRDDKLLAEDWNSLVGQGRARILADGVANTREAPQDYSWKTSTARFDAARKWKVFVAPGFINDTVPAISYLKNDDPRAWDKPADYPAPKPGETGYSEYFIDRDLLETDPPFLLVESPEGNDANASFSPVSDAARIPYFQTEAMWEKQIFSAHVILVSTPLRSTFFPASLPPPPLARYRLAVVPRPLAATFAARAGGWLELARLFLVRDEKTGPAGDSLLVMQREFHNLAASVVTPSQQFAAGQMSSPASFGGIGLGLADSFSMGISDTYNAFVSQIQAEIDNILAPTASVEFWTV